jgi:lipoyl-dependent peroxiredoxin subunit D
MSSIEHIKSRLPDFAKDQRINLGIIASSTELTPSQAWGCAVASAAAARNAELLQAISAEASAHVSTEAIQSALGAASIMAMNNVYYRFMHFMEGDADVTALPARLRMQIIGKPGVDHLDFELWCLAVSAINGCENCVKSHAHVALEHCKMPLASPQ